MFNSLILDVSIGLVFVYFILSLLCSVLIEGIASIFQWRATMLRQKIGELLNDPEAVKNLYNNPLFLGTTPSYISSRSFVLALLGSLQEHERVKEELKKLPAANRGISLDSVPGIKELVEKLPEESDIRKALVPLLETAPADLDKALTGMEKWYDEAMDRVSGWYKRKSQKVALALAFMIALGLNADTFQISKSLYGDQTVRVVLVSSAQELVKKEPPKDTQLEGKIAEIEKAFKMGIPLGWPDKDFKWELKGDNLWAIFIKFWGIVLTALLVTLGSNFWFDLLNRLINLRSTGKKPLTAEEEKAKQP